jgi:hypothetical protein
MSLKKFVSSPAGQLAILGIGGFVIFRVLKKEVTTSVKQLADVGEEVVDNLNAPVELIKQVNHSRLIDESIQLTKDSHQMKIETALKTGFWEGRAINEKDRQELNITLANIQKSNAR